MRLIYACLRLLVPTNARQIAFASDPDCADNAYALFERVMRSPYRREFVLVWLVADEAKADRTLRRQYSDVDLHRVKIVSKNTLRGLFWFLRSRYVFFTHRLYWFARCGCHQTIVNLWHGMPIKAVGELLGPSVKTANVKIPFGHYAVATSSFFSGVMGSALGLPRERVLVTGLPRNEWLFQPDPCHAVVRGDRAKLVVWLPTFRQWSIRVRLPFADEMVQTDTAKGAPDLLGPATLNELDEALERADVMLVIKLHPFDAKNRQKWPTYKNIRIYSDEKFRAEGLNVYKLLACADALVTDFSSIAIDYLLLRKPIGFFAPDQFAYTRPFIPEVLERVSRIGHQLISVEDLAAFIKNPAEAPETAADMELLHSSTLRHPSDAILCAVGLSALVSKRTDAQPASS